METMMTDRDRLVAEIEAFLAETGMLPTTFGQLALNDAGFMSRLSTGRDFRYSTGEKIRKFMHGYRSRHVTHSAA